MTKHKRLPWLMALMVGVAAFVWWSSPEEVQPAAAAPVAVRAVVTLAPGTASAATQPSLVANAIDASASTDVPGNAFTVRLQEIPVQWPVVAPVVKRERAPPILPVVASIPPPPWEVIGSWDDGKVPGLFISGPTGTLIARVGLELMNEFKVIAISPQQLTLQHLASKREFNLPVPRGTGQ